MVEAPFSVYLDFDTICGKISFEFVEEIGLYSVSFAFVVAFNLALKIDRIFVERSFSPTFDDLSDINYLSN